MPSSYHMISPLTESVSEIFQRAQNDVESEREEAIALWEEYAPGFLSALDELSKISGDAFQWFVEPRPVPRTNATATSYTRIQTNLSTWRGNRPFLRNAGAGDCVTISLFKFDHMAAIGISDNNVYRGDEFTSVDRAIYSISGIISGCMICSDAPVRNNATHSQVLGDIACPS